MADAGDTTNLTPTGLVRHARQALRAAVEGRAAPASLGGGPARGLFVTLRSQSGALRGCVGQTRPRLPLAEAVASLTASASRDPRFPPVQARELDELVISLSLLTPLEPVHDIDEVEVGHHGLELSLGGRRGVLLPEVPVEHGWDREAFLRVLCQKAGLTAGSWRHPEAELWRFESEVIEEPYAQV